MTPIWNGVWAQDDALYVASNSAGVLVFDLADPANPRFVQRATVPGATSTINVHTVFVEGSRLHAMSPSLRQTLVFDISTPLAPQFVTRYVYSAGAGYPHDALASNGRLYVNHTTDGFLVVDLEAASPTLLGRYNYPQSYSHANALPREGRAGGEEPVVCRDGGGAEEGVHATIGPGGAATQDGKRWTCGPA